MFETLSKSIDYIQGEWKMHRVMANDRYEDTAESFSRWGLPRIYFSHFVHDAIDN